MSTPVLYYVEIRNVADLETDETLALEAVVAGINYNGSATEFSWTVFPSNAGTFSDATDQRPIFTPSTGLSAAITAHVSVTATIYGTGDNSNLTATASDTSDSFVITPHIFPPRVPTTGPFIQASAGGTFKDGTGIALSITQSGQIADEISYIWAVAGDITGSFDDNTIAEPTFTPVLTGLQVGDTATISCVLVYRGTGTNAINGQFVSTTAVREIRYKPILAAPNISISISQTEVLRWTQVQLDVIALGGIYDALTYAWSVVPAGAGTFSSTTIANPVFDPDDNLSSDTDAVLRVQVTPVTNDTDRIAANNSLVSPTAEVNLKILTTTRFDDVADGYWEEAPQPGIQISLDPATMPLVAEWRQGSDRWQALPGEWGDRTAGDENTVPHPSFIDTEIRDLAVVQNRLVFLTIDTVSLSVTGQVGQFWGLSARAVTHADPIDLSLGNETAAEELRLIGGNLLAIGDAEHWFIYAPKEGQGWHPGSVRVEHGGLSALDQRAGVAFLDTPGNGFSVIATSSDNRPIALSLVGDKPELVTTELGVKVPKLLSNTKIIDLAGVSNTHTVAYASSNRLWLGRFFGRERLVWTTHTFGGDAEILSIAGQREWLLMIVRVGTSVLLERLYLGDHYTGDPLERPCTDHWTRDESDMVTGMEYRSTAKFSPLYLSAQDGSPTLPDHFNLRQWNLYHVDTPYFEVTVKQPAPNTHDLNLTYSVGDSQDDLFEVPVKTDATRLDVTVSSDKVLPFSIVGVEWQGQYYERGQRG